MARRVSLLCEAALAYAARGWRVIPLYEVRQGHCRCSQGTQCHTPGKHPPLHDWVTQATTDGHQIQRWWKRWPEANVGIVTGGGSQLVVLDIDPRHAGDTNLEELQAMYATLPETVLMLSGGGGQHYYFFCTEALPACDLAHGIQCQSEGRLVVAPPSRHASGCRYAWELSHDPDDIPLAPLPEWIRALVLSNHHDDQPSTVSLPDTLPPVDIKTLHVSNRIKHVILTGQDPDNPTRYSSRSEAVFGVTQALIHGGHSDATIAAILLNPIFRISDKPRSQRDPRSSFYEQNIRGWVAKEIGRAHQKYAPSRNGIPLEDVGETASSPPPSLATATAPWRERLLTNKKGDPSENAGNIGLILANHPWWQEKFWWDSVRSLPMVEEAPLTDEYETLIAQWLGTHERMPVKSLRLLQRCLLVECKKTPRDLLQTWLNGLPIWDHIPRLGEWLSDVAQVNKTAYGIAVSKLLPLSMVARALSPGCLYRYVVILEGPENTGKSSLVQALAGPGWYIELTQALESKESHMMLQGAWVAEMAELDSLTRTEETRLKAFITLRDDSYIPKYSNNRITTPRRTIFVGTTNEESYLKGQTGNTRFLPIKTGAIDIPLFLAMREQLFAEALWTYQAAPDTWWMMSEEALAEADEEREKRRSVTVYEPDLQEWLAARRFREEYMDNGRLYHPQPGETTWQEIARWFLRIETPERWKDISLQKQIAQSLKALGWRQDIIWRDGRTTRVWLKGSGDEG